MVDDSGAGSIEIPDHGEAPLARDSHTAAVRGEGDRGHVLGLVLRVRVQDDGMGERVRGVKVEESAPTGIALHGQPAAVGADPLPDAPITAVNRARSSRSMRSLTC
jgi:hypothetical protein